MRLKKILSLVMVASMSLSMISGLCFNDIKAFAEELTPDTNPVVDFDNIIENDSETMYISAEYNGELVEYSYTITVDTAVSYRGGHAAVGATITYHFPKTISKEAFEHVYHSEEYNPYHRASLDDINFSAERHNIWKTEGKLPIRFHKVVFDVAPGVEYNVAESMFEGWGETDLLTPYDSWCLRDVHFDSGLKEIGDFAFNGCVNLRSITSEEEGLMFPSSLTKIGTSAFYATGAVNGNIIFPFKNEQVIINSLPDANVSRNIYAYNPNCLFSEGINGKWGFIIYYGGIDRKKTTIYGYGGLKTAIDNFDTAYERALAADIPFIDLGYIFDDAMVNFEVNEDIYTGEQSSISFNTIGEKKQLSITDNGTITGDVCTYDVDETSVEGDYVSNDYQPCALLNTKDLIFTIENSDASISNVAKIVSEERSLSDIGYVVSSGVINVEGVIPGDANITARYYNQPVGSDSIKVIEKPRIEINGFQLNPSYGVRTVYSTNYTEEEAEQIGIIYGFVAGGISKEDMVHGSSNTYVRSFAGTAVGKNSISYTDLEDASSYTMTMTFGGSSAAAYNARYYVRAFAKLKDGTVKYSDVYEYSAFDVAKDIYENGKVENKDKFDSLYKILTKVDPTYPERDFDWNNTIAMNETTDANIEISGFSISSTVKASNGVIGGIKMLYSTKYDEQDIKKIGILMSNKQVEDKDSFTLDNVGNSIYAFNATSAGKYSITTTTWGVGNTYAMTMTFSYNTSSFFNNIFSIRSYVELADGTIEYSDVVEFSVAEVAKYLYENKMMSSLSSHTFLYDNILSVVDAEYEKIDFEYINTLVK